MHVYPPQMIEPVIHLLINQVYQLFTMNTNDYKLQLRTCVTGSNLHFTLFEYDLDILLLSQT